MLQYSHPFFPFSHTLTVVSRSEKSLQRYNLDAPRIFYLLDTIQHVVSLSDAIQFMKLMTYLCHTVSNCFLSFYLTALFVIVMRGSGPTKDVHDPFLASSSAISLPSILQWPDKQYNLSFSIAWLFESTLMVM